MSKIPKNTRTIAIPYQINEELSKGKMLCGFPSESLEPVTCEYAASNPIMSPKISKIIPIRGSIPLFSLLLIE
jgi:hypothetical protein